jgi:hypothetical protein
VGSRRARARPSTGVRIRTGAVLHKLIWDGFARIEQHELATCAWCSHYVRVDKNLRVRHVLEGVRPQQCGAGGVDQLLVGRVVGDDSTFVEHAGGEPVVVITDANSQ